MRARGRVPTTGLGVFLALAAVEVAATGVIPAVTGGLAAQEGAPSPEEPRAGCFRGHPLPVCSSFWLVELQGLAVVHADQRTLRRGDLPPIDAPAFESRGELTVGHMLNLGVHWAVGGGVTLGTGAHGPLAGARLRARRWLDHELGLEVESGLVRTTPGPGRPEAVGGFSAGIRLNVQDRGALVVRWDVVDLEPRELSSGLVDPGGRLGAVSLGAAAGSLPALAGTGLVGVALIVLVGVAAAAGG